MLKPYTIWTVINNRFKWFYVLCGSISCMPNIGPTLKDDSYRVAGT